MSHHPIMIAGGGAGGLELAARLGRSLGKRHGPQRILLIDKSIFHLWKPSFHEVAAGSLDAHQEGLSYLTLARLNHFSYVFGEIESLEPDRQQLALAEARNSSGRLLIPKRKLAYDKLVLALGSGSNLFDTPGAAEHAHLLEDVADAEAFHRRLTEAYLASAYSPKRRLDVAIVGAGATGVELASELIEGHRAFVEGLASRQRFELCVTVIEAGPRILGSLSPRLAAKAARELRRRGVNMLVGAKVQKVEADGVQTTQGWAHSDLTVWAAGVMASPGNRNMGLEIGALNQFVVDDRLRTTAPHVFAIGDCAQARHGDGFVPARAQAAAQQARYLSKTLLGSDRRAFIYEDRGSLVSLGNERGIGSLMGGLVGPDLLIEGWLARQAYRGLHLDHHRTAIGLRRTALLVLSRLLMRRVSGRLKLH